MTENKKVVFQLKFEDDTYEIYEQTQDVKKLKELIRQKLPLRNEPILSWSRKKDDDYVTIVDNSNLQRCISYQAHNQIDEIANEYFVVIKVVEGPPGVLPDSRDLSKSTQLLYHLRPPRMSDQQIQQQQLLQQQQQQLLQQQQQQQHQSLNQLMPPQQNQLQLQARPLSPEYDKEKYTPFTCYNCGGGEDLLQQQIEGKCAICDGTGKLPKSKEIDAIEYLIEKRLCQLYPELKSIYKRFQNQNDESKIKRDQDNNNNNSIKTSQEHKPLEPLQVIQEGKQTSQTEKQSENIVISEKPKEDTGNEQRIKDAGKGPEKRQTIDKKQKFKSMFNAPASEKQGSTPDFEAEEVCSFEVIHKKGDSGEIKLESGKTTNESVEIKVKEGKWPNKVVYIEEAHGQHFEKQQQGQELFKKNEETDKIVLTLKPQGDLPTGSLITSWKIYTIAQDQTKQYLQGVIPLKFLIV